MGLKEVKVNDQLTKLFVDLDNKKYNILMGYVLGLGLPGNWALSEDYTKLVRVDNEASEQAPAETAS
jgi:hypothetical protein